MNADLQGKVALVTGGAVRVGRAISLALAAAGCDLLIHYGRSATPAGETAAAARAFGVNVHTHQANLADAAETAGIIPAGVAALGHIDILINNAAIFLDGGLTDTTLAMWQTQMAINLQAPFLLSQAFVQQLGTRPGQIINISDARITRPGADHFAYRLTKTALVAMTEGLALELAPNVRVNAVALGAILPPPGEDERYIQTLAQQRVPLRRPGNAQLVAENVLHLLRQEFLTGVTIRLDGGEFL